MSNSDANHPIYYFPDGNLVIRCQSKIDDSPSMPVHFRVHRGYLSAQSSVFSDILTLPQGKVSDIYEGLPVVDFPTSSETMANFLSLLYDPGHEILLESSTDLAFKLLNVIVLADMLMIEPIKRLIISRLKQDWHADSARRWLDKIRAFNAPRPGTEDLWIRPGTFFEPGAALHIARRFDETLITPMLLLELAFRHPYLQYDEPIEFPDRSLSLRARWELVSISDKRELWKLREWVLAQIARRLSSLRIRCTADSASGSGSERGPIDSTDCKEFFADQVYMVSIDLFGGFRPLCSLENLKVRGKTLIDNEPEGSLVICSDCGARWDKKLEELQTDVFSNAEQFLTILNQV